MRKTDSRRRQSGEGGAFLALPQQPLPYPPPPGGYREGRLATKLHHRLTAPLGAQTDQTQNVTGNGL
ncbi:protein of unknown function [Bradyrhizobium sp. ORS 285]|nr:hypothetical protein BRAO285_1120006 [Bradyrhizobium sp. ORS 285]SMX56583.1 protein of unknown function [Bradyrhizobium sp. ORS 285]